MIFSLLVKRLLSNKTLYKAVFLAIVFPLLLPSANSNNHFTYKYSIKTNASFFTVDPLNNIFLIESGNIIRVDNKSGKKKHYSNPSIGSFNLIDASNSLNVMGFIKNPGVIVFFDKNLTEKDIFDFRNFQFQEPPEMSCNSRQDGFWVYSAENWKFSRVDRKNNLLAETRPMYMINQEFYKPCFMTEAKSKFYVSDKNNGIFVFDIFGGFLYNIPINNICYFQVRNDNLIYFKNKNLYFYNLLLQSKLSIELPIKNYKMGYITNEFIYILTNEELIVYSLNKNIF